MLKSKEKSNSTKILSDPENKMNKALDVPEVWPYITGPVTAQIDKLRKILRPLPTKLSKRFLFFFFLFSFNFNLRKIHMVKTLTILKGIGVKDLVVPEKEFIMSYGKKRQ